MSAKFQYSEAMNPSDLQIWDNAAFDNGESQDSSISWCVPKSSIVNRTDSSVNNNCSSKENRSVVNPNCAIEAEATKIKSIKPASEQDVRDAKKIDMEIEDIEKQMNLLAARLHVLKLEKAEQTLKLNEMRGGRIVRARFMENKDSVKENNGGNLKKIEEKWVSSVKSKVGRRGVSMCPGDIRGGSLHTDGGIKSTQLYKTTEMTPVKTIENRRKSCFWKLQDVDELKAIKSSSLSPKLKDVVGKIQGVGGGPRQAVTTIGSRKAVKKDDGVLAAIQPKKLFGDGEKSVTAKKPMKAGRVVASRYNQSTFQSDMRKRSLPENDKDEKTGRIRSSSIGKSCGAMPDMSGIQGSECRVKKRWDVQSESVICGDLEAERSKLLGCVVPAVLPKIRTARHTIDTPRDSGPAKRVVELIGKKSFFVDSGDVESSVCQELSFADGE